VIYIFNQTFVFFSLFKKMNPAVINEQYRPLTQSYAYFAIVLLSAFVLLSVYLVNNSIIKNKEYQISNEYLSNTFKKVSTTVKQWYTICLFILIISSLIL